MYSSLPRPGGSKLPAPASILQYHNQLSEVPDSILNTQGNTATKDLQETFTKPSLRMTLTLSLPQDDTNCHTAAMISRTLQTSTLKRPAPASFEGAENKPPMQVARSAINQTPG